MLKLINSMKGWPTKNKIREPQFAGQFYEGDRTGLTQQLIGLFEEVKSLDSHSTRDQLLQALITPHAGYIFSGKVAASAYHQIPDKANYKRVFVLASSHRYSFKGAAVFCNDYKTPLGDIKIDTQFCENLLKTSELFLIHSQAHENEHSIEVQLPFLQHKLGNNILLVPIILGTSDPEICQKIAEELKPWFTPENLWVISTDFSHYPEYDDASEVDFLTATAVCSNQPEKLQTVLKENKKLKSNNLATSLCGWTSVLTLLYLTENKEYAFEKILYQNSGDSKIYGSKNRIVGYWSIAIYGQNDTFSISKEEKKELLEKARFSITTFVNTGKKGNLIEPNSQGILNEITGAFVSVYVNGKLRGCIGGFAQEKILNDLVQQMAVSASHDRRFSPVKSEELKNMGLEISVLSPLKKIVSVNEIVLGKHGVYLKKDSNSGTFLPQVATKTGWDLEQFLGHCSRDKAGIGWDGWKTAEIFTYEAIIFREE